MGEHSKLDCGNGGARGPTSEACASIVFAALAAFWMLGSPTAFRLGRRWLACALRARVEAIATMGSPPRALFAAILRGAAISLIPGLASVGRVFRGSRSVGVAPSHAQGASRASFFAWLAAWIAAFCKSALPVSPTGRMGSLRPPIVERLSWLFGTPTAMDGSPVRGVARKIWPQVSRILALALLVAACGHIDQALAQATPQSCAAQSGPDGGQNGPFNVFTFYIHSNGACDTNPNSAVFSLTVNDNTGVVSIAN